MKAPALTVLAALLLAGCATWSGDPSGTSQTSGPSNVSGTSGASGSFSTNGTTGPATNTSQSSGTTTASSNSTTGTTSATTNTTGTSTSGTDGNATTNATAPIPPGLRIVSASRVPTCFVVLRIGDNCHVVAIHVWNNDTVALNVSAAYWTGTTEDRRMQAVTFAAPTTMAAGQNGTVTLRWAVTDGENDDRFDNITYANPRYNATSIRVAREYSIARQPIADLGGQVDGLRLACSAVVHACPMPSNHPNDLMIMGVNGDPLDPASPQYAFDAELRIVVSRHEVGSDDPFEQLDDTTVRVYPEAFMNTYPPRALYLMPGYAIEIGYEYKVYVRAKLAATDDIVEAEHSVIY